MKPTEELVHEHEVILHVLGAAGKEAQRMREEEVIHPEFLEKVLDFSKNFTDKCHHAKEENHLFPMLELRGVLRDGGIIAAMLADHVEGRRLISAMRTALPAALGNRETVRSLARDLASYVALLEEHIAKENAVLFPMADRLFTETEQRSLEKAFEGVEKEEMGEGVHEKYHRLAHEISEASGPG